MLILLIPPPPHPTIMFKLSFPDVLPGGLPPPPAWAIQLSMLAADDLEPPPSLHALDKSASLINLVSEVAYDVAALTVSCVFVDGTKEEWPVLGAGFVEALESVLNDVNNSAAETHLDNERELERERQKELLLAMTVPTPAQVTPNKHKKQRSLLMSLVASLIPSSSSLSSPPSPPLPLYLPPPPPPPSPRLLSSARCLRRRARASLVDIFRRYVLSELSLRKSPGGYYTWIMQSMVRRIAERMAGLVQEAGGRVPDLVQALYPGGDGIGCGLQPESVDAALPSPFYSDDEEGEASDETTDTDGSSLRTPSSSSVNTANHPQRWPSATHPPPYDTLRSCSLSPSSCAEYTSLSAYNRRLRHLLFMASSMQAHEVSEAKRRETMLEIRGKRRAWLNKCLLVSDVGDGIGGIWNGGVGMAMPFQKSPLGQSGWTAEDVEGITPETVWDDGGGELMLRPSGRWAGDARLFPVNEEEADEDDDAAGPDVAELELELDGMGREEEDRFPFEMERPKILPRTRMRTLSMHRMGSIPRSVLQHPRPCDPTTPLLCQPIKRCRDVDVFDYEGDEAFGQNRGGYVDEEFTLAMDLPFKAGEKEVFSKPARMYEREMKRERVWTPPGLIGVAVDCR